MADYTAKARTNYFRVDNVKQFISDIADTKANISLAYIPADKSDSTEIYNFAASHGITLERTDSKDHICSIAVLMPDGDPSEDADIRSVIQDHISPHDACIIQEAGWEKMRYVTGFATIITNNNIRYVSLEECARSVAKNMLKNQNWNAKTDY